MVCIAKGCRYRLICARSCARDTHPTPPHHGWPARFLVARRPKPHLAKVRVAGSNPVVRSARNPLLRRGFRRSPSRSLS